MYPSKILFTPLRAFYESPSTTSDMCGQFLFMGADSVALLATGATANLARSRRLEHRKKFLKLRGLLRVSTYPACARSKSGDGRRGEVRYSADTPAGIAGCPEEFAAFAPEAEIPAFLRKGALGTLGGRSES